jgi:Cu/Ag efflux protein CusF
MQTIAALLLIPALLATPALAQQPADAHAGHHPTGATASAAEKADGEVRRIDKAGGRLTLRHGEIKSLDMPPMTMVFRVRDPALLDGLKVGDKIRFTAESAGGNNTVTSIEAAR